MASKLDTLLLKSANVFNRHSPFLATVNARLLLRRRPVTLGDLQFATTYAHSYALISEKKSARFALLMDRLVRYTGTGPIGPNKFWEYPWVLANLRLEAGMSVLDAGCGRSPLQFLMAHVGCAVSGIDPHENVAWHGIRRDLPARFGCTVNYRVDGIERIGFPDDSFDRVCCVSVLEHCRAAEVADEKMTPQTDADRALQRRMMDELVRVLKPGGLLVVTVDYNFPRSNCLGDSNVDVKNLLAVEGAALEGSRCREAFPGEPGFDPWAVIANGDVDVSNYLDTLQTSIGFVLKKTPR